MRPRRFDAAAGALLALALVAKLAALAQLSGHPLLQPVGGLDSEHYVALGGRVAAGDLLLGPGVYYLSPLYAYFLGVVFLLTGGSLLAARLVQALLGVAALALIYGTGRALYGRRAGLVAMALAGATGLFTFYEILLIQAALDPFLVALTLYLLVRAAGAGEAGRAGAAPMATRWQAWLAAGLALGLLTLNRPNALPVAFVLAAWLALGGWAEGARRGAARVVAAAALLGGLCLAVAPVTLRNLVVAGDPVLISSHGGLNFYIGNNPSADGTYHDVPGITPSIAGQAADMRRVAERAAGRTLSDGEVSSYFYGQAREWLLARPGQAASLFARKLYYTFHAAFLPLTHSYPYYAWDERGVLTGLLVGPWLLVPLGLFGLVAGSRRGWLPCDLLAVFVGVYALSVAAFFVSARYRMPLLVPLCVASGAGVEWWLTRAASGKARSLALAAVALLAVGVAANWPSGLDDGRFEERVRMAVWLAAEGDTARAEALAARADERHPSAGLMHYRLGQAYAGRGEWEAARRHHERALQLDPGQGEIHLSLGQTLLALGRPGEAEAHLRRALDGGVRPEAARSFLARALEQQGLQQAVAGDPAAAAGPLESARSLAPRQPSILLNLAVVYAQLGRVEDARRLAREALAADPTYERARRFLEEVR